MNRRRIGVVVSEDERIWSADVQNYFLLRSNFSGHRTGTGRADEK